MDSRRVAVPENVPVRPGENVAVGLGESVGVPGEAVRVSCGVALYVHVDSVMVPLPQVTLRDGGVGVRVCVGVKVRVPVSLNSGEADMERVPERVEQDNEGREGVALERLRVRDHLLGVGEGVCVGEKERDAVRGDGVGLWEVGVTVWGVRVGVGLREQVLEHVESVGVGVGLRDADGEGGEGVSDLEPGEGEREPGLGV